MADLGEGEDADGCERAAAYEVCCRGKAHAVGPLVSGDHNAEDGRSWYGGDMILV